MHDIAEFLSKHDPFVALEPAQLEHLAERVEIEYFEVGSTIFRQGEGPPDAMWVVRTGAVELRESGRVLDLLGEGEPFGHPWMLSGLPIGWEARAHENSLCYRLAADDVVPLLSDPAGLRAIAKVLVQRPRPASASTADGLDANRETVRTLIRKPPVVCDPGTPLRTAVAGMEKAGASSILVDLGNGGLGIVTDRDLRSRVVAEGRALDTPISEVMSTPVFTVGPEQTGAELMLTMIDRGIRHVPVLSGLGELLGVVSDIDLLAAETRTPIMLRRAITDATEIEALHGPAAQLNSTVVAMHEAGVAPARISGILSVVVDALVRRLIELTVADLGPVEQELGWLSLGSFGRREAVPSSDVDSGMVWSRAAGDDPAALMHRLAGVVIGALAEMGWHADAHGVAANETVFTCSIDEWRAAIGKWLEPPTSDQQLVAISILLDARTIYGPDRGLDVTSVLRDAHPRPELLTLLLRQALATRPPTGFLRDIVVEHSGEHAGHFDIKHGGLLPIVNIARYAGLAAEATTTSTIERLRASSGAGILSESDAATLVEAFELFSVLRLEHQVGQLEAAVTPDNLIDPKTLNPLERRYLRDAFRAVASVQRALDTKLTWSA